MFLFYSYSIQHDEVDLIYSVDATAATLPVQACRWKECKQFSGHHELELWKSHHRMRTQGRCLHHRVSHWYMIFIGCLNLGLWSRGMQMLWAYQVMVPRAPIGPDHSNSELMLFSAFNYLQWLSLFFFHLHILRYWHWFLPYQVWWHTIFWQAEDELFIRLNILSLSFPWLIDDDNDPRVSTPLAVNPMRIQPLSFLCLCYRSSHLLKVR